VEADHEERTPNGAGTAIAHPLRAVGAALRRGVRRLAVWNAAEGARESGLARLVELHALQTAGDAFITVALAGSLFFSVPTNQARTQVGLYLLVAMAPFAVVAPLLGPLLDRFAHGRRLAIAATMAVRATLALVMGHALAGGDLSTTDKLALYPAALGVLVMQKTYTVARGATVPRVLPPGMSLVRANARLTLAGIFVPAIAAAVAVALRRTAGDLWSLRVGAAVYVVATIVALRLPRRADGGQGTHPAEEIPRLGRLSRLGEVDGYVAGILRSAAALRWLAGFLLFYGAFVVQEDSLAGLPRPVALAWLAVGLTAGNFLGTVLGSRTADVPAARLAVVLVGATTATAILTAIEFGLLTMFAIAVVSAAAAAMAKLSLDAAIQHHVAEHVRTSTFGRSETTLQLAWVVGGGVGIALPTTPAIGFGVASAVLAVALVTAVRFARRTPTAAPL
jgi:MFS family permease